LHKRELVEPVQISVQKSFLGVQIDHFPAEGLPP
jgi:hypothetical protein